MHLTESTRKKWESIIEHKDLPAIKDNYRKTVVTQLLENTYTAAHEEQLLSEAGVPANVSGGLGAGTNIASFDPVMISLMRRAMPNLIAYDVASVQPMNGPTGLIFAMRARYVGVGNATATLNDDPEALFNEALTAFAGAGSNGTVGDVTVASDQATDPSVMMNTPAGAYTTGRGMTTAQAEALGSVGGDPFGQMGFTIERVTATAKSRALKAEYTLELAQDLKKIHGLDAEAELANILTTEIITEINREVVRTIFITAKIGCAAGTTANVGVFDLDVDSNGRWSVERFKGLMFHIEREANQIAKETRRGRGNFIICSSDVASALAMAGVLDYAPALQTNLNVDDAGNTFVGVLNGRYKVYIDPYFASTNGDQFIVVGYKGDSPYDAGLFYCPYVPLQMVRAVGEDNFQPRIGFKTRYAMVNNPYAEGLTQGLGALTPNANVYYRKFKVKNLM